MANETSRIPAGFTLVEEDDEVEVKETPTTTEVKEEVEETSEVKETSAIPAGFTLVEDTDSVEETDDSVEETTTEVEEEIPPKGSGVASLPKPKSPEEELQKRKMMMIAQAVWVFLCFLQILFPE